MFGRRGTRSPFVEVFQRADGLFDWHLVAGNAEIVCGSVQGFTSKWDAKASYDTAMTLLGSGLEVRFKTNPEAKRAEAAHD